jgi:CRP/FNR family transcriptional regulator
MKTPDATMRILKAVPYFAGLDLTVLATVADRCRSKVLQEGQFVFVEGDPCQALYILESGRVKFYRASAEGREQTLKLFDRPGDTFCIPSAFSTGTHIVSAKAVTDARLYLLDIDTVNRLAGEHPSVALKLVATAGEHMQSLVTLAEDLSLKTVTARLAKFLCEQAAGEDAQHGREIQLPRDHLPEEELASMLGTVRVHISRSLMNLARAGAIELTRGFIRIRNLTLLKQIAEGKS